MERPEREAVGYRCGDFAERWCVARDPKGKTGWRVLPAPDLDELDRDEPTDSDEDAMEDEQ